MGAYLIYVLLVLAGFAMWAMLFAFMTATAIISMIDARRFDLPRGGTQTDRGVPVCIMLE